MIDGRKYNHIIDPKTCRPIDNGLASASVVVEGNIAHCATVADILSTAIFVRGDDRFADGFKTIIYRS